MSGRFDPLVEGAMQALRTANDRAFEPASYAEIAGVFAELAKAEAMLRQAAAVEKLAEQVGRLANAVQQR